MVTKPLVVVDREGAVLDASLLNEKAFAKSTEHGKLWYLHADTGRVLPYRGNLSFTEIVDAGASYRATVDADMWRKSAASTGSVTGAGVAPATGDGRELESTSPSLGQWELVLRDLVAIITDRKANLPEGSYTSYLFAAGESKIRKKTGEEAIELVLSQSPEETTSEAADLIYHVLVLLAQLDISFDEVIRELANRG